MAERAERALRQIPEPRRQAAALIYTAHSLPVEMAARCDYQQQVQEACRLVSEKIGREHWDLAFQSRSGPPSQAWLGPDVGELLVQRHARSPLRDVAIVPMGFLTECMETVYDLDVEIGGLCQRLGIHLERGVAVGSHPRLVEMIRALILERVEEQPVRLAVGRFGPAPDVCGPGCCPPR
jgi:ferrochelatase